ncbi:competence/damage-inducible protein A [Tepidamorphus sp. 3E244]|uniref:competence/damage-inducible protein A n=1 Tax=Tepidamorphus sp. 3E244 TaxID=3385498 RepID=UPI0038FCBC93
MSDTHEGQAGEGADEVSAAILVIGDEILSGRTKDKNIGYIAEYLTEIGIDIREVRVVPDDPPEIAAAVNALRARYDYLFTTGGIGPTHDDITADCVADAFGVALEVREDAVSAMRNRYPELELTPARLRMARIPEGGTLIDNPVSGAPGFVIGNVIVMAGVPKIMQAMLDNVAPTLKGGKPLLSETRTGAIREGDIAGPLGELQARFPETRMGSYPGYTDKGFQTSVVVRARDPQVLASAIAEVEKMIAEYRRD